MTSSYLSDFTRNGVAIKLENLDHLTTKENFSKNYMLSDHYIQKLEVGSTYENLRSQNRTEIYNQNLKPVENTKEIGENKMNFIHYPSKNKKITPSNNLEIGYQNSSVLKTKLLLNDEFLNRIYLANEIEQVNALNDMFDNMIVNNFIIDYSRENNLKEKTDKISEKTNLKDKQIHKKLNINSYYLHNPQITQLDNLNTFTNCQNSSGDINSLDSIYNIDIRSNHFILESELNYQISNSIENFISNLFNSTQNLIVNNTDNNTIESTVENPVTNLLSLNKTEKTIKNKPRKIENQLSEVKSSFKNPDNKLSEYLPNDKQFKSSSSIKSVTDSFSNIPIEIKEIKHCYIIKNINCTNIIKRNSSNSLTNESPDSQTQLQDFQLNIENENLMKESVENPKCLNKQNTNQNEEIYQVNIKGKNFLFKESDLLKLNSFDNLSRNVHLKQNFKNLFSVENPNTYQLINNDQIKVKKQSDAFNLQNDLESACYKIIYGNASEFSQQLIEAIDIKSKQNKLENEIKKVLNPEYSDFNQNKISKQLSAIRIEPFKLRRTDCNLQASPSNILLSQASSCNDNLLETYSLITETEIPTLNYKTLSISPKKHLETSPSKQFQSKSNFQSRSTMNNNKSNIISTKSIFNNNSKLYNKNVLSIKSSNVKEELITKKKSYFIEDHNFSQRFIPSEILNEIKENKLDANYSNGILGTINNTDKGCLLNLKGTFLHQHIFKRSKRLFIKRSLSTGSIKPVNSIIRNHKIKSK